MEPRLNYPYRGAPMVETEQDRSTSRWGIAVLILHKVLLYYGRPVGRPLYSAAVVSSFFFVFLRRLFSAVADCMSAILLHIMRP